MADVFISYKAEDRPRVEPLVDALEAEGLSVWWDARVGGGEAWRETIAEQLDAAGCVIVIWSKRSTGPEGRFVRDEATRSQRRGIYLPVTIDKVDPPLGFGETQALSLRGWRGGSSDPRYRAISDCVHSLLGRKKTARRRSAHASPPESGSRIDRRAALAAGGAAVLAAGAGGWLLLRPGGAHANTVAVLPFANLSGDPSQNYFSDGIAEELRNALSALGGLQVVARTSSEMLRNADAVTAAQRLRVANVITGSVRRSPSTIRVSAQLVDGKNGLEQWSQTFDRPFGDVLQIQSDIAQNVARALSVQLQGDDRDPRALGGTHNPEAQDLLLQGTALVGDDSSEAMLRRIALFDQATRVDPNYAEAWAYKGLNQALWASTWARDAAEKDRGEADALKSIQRAIAIAPEMSQAYSALGVLYHNQLMMKRALEVQSRSVELRSADSLTFFNYALSLAQTRRQREAESMIERAINLDPLNPGAHQVKGTILFYGRRYAQSIESARHAVAIAPKNGRARTQIGWDLLLLGRADEAAREWELVPADDYRRLVGEAAAAARARRKDVGLRAIDTIRKRYGDAANYQYAEIYAQLGMVDQGIAALETAWKKRDSGLTSMLVDPFVDPLRSDARFGTIAKRVFS